jgi:hypothetical protein
MALPEVYEERAWVGVRWRIRKRTFAHVLGVDAEWPRWYARASGVDRPSVVLTFRSPSPELDALANAGPPFFKPQWPADMVGMVLGTDIVDTDINWAEVAELLTESYCLLAPRKLADRVDRP